MSYVPDVGTARVSRANQRLRILRNALARMPGEYAQNSPWGVQEIWPKKGRKMQKIPVMTRLQLDKQMLGIGTLLQFCLQLGNLTEGMIFMHTTSYCHEPVGLNNTREIWRFGREDARGQPVVRSHAPQLLVLSRESTEDIKKCCGKFGDPRVARVRSSIWLCICFKILSKVLFCIPLRKEDGTAEGFLHGFTCEFGWNRPPAWFLEGSDLERLGYLKSRSIMGSYLEDHPS